MKILLLSTSDIEGGAARAAYRLHQGLKAIGKDSKMLVRAKFSHDRSVIVEQSLLTKLGPTFNGLPLRSYPKRSQMMFSPQWFPDAIASSVARMNPDVVNMHWVCNGYLKIETLARLGKPLVWTLQDMWPFTGGCHYNQDCDRYTNACGNCPQLNSGRDNDLSYQVWRRKQNAWKNINLSIVTPSSWMADCVKASSLFKDRRVEVIPFCLDTHRYQPVEKTVARRILNLPEDKQLVLFGALAATADKRKGFSLLVPALQSLSQSGWREQIELVVFGSDEPENPVDLGFKTHYLGHLNDDLSLAIVYSAADVMIVPSLQESFGQTASEALACATPVVAFDATGLKDIVDHQQNGYKAKPYEIDDLAAGIAWVLEDGDRHQKLCFNAREKAERAFSQEVQTRGYLSLFSDLLQSQKN
jgi:glycosyltransferase involved in cell wall biosynthesis